MAQKEVVVFSDLGETMKVECSAGNHKFVIDQPKVSGGQDLGPTPLEYYLAALGGCISTIGRIVARQKQISLRGMKIKTTGSIDTDVLLGKNTTDRAGFQNITLEISIDADLTDAQKEEFLHEVDRRCPVSDNTIHESAVTFKLVG